ncbi:MAG: hypothetical protein WAW17_25040 [Rhodococcus sp. (in: high G+C Gram-positive bacteria)]
MDDRGETQEFDRTEGKRRRPSPLLLLTGLTALAISFWALAGPFSVEPLTNVEFRWLFVGAAVVVGVVLVFAPHRRT